MAKDRYVIVSAPSKYDLMLGVFEMKPLTYRVEEGLSFDVYVSRLDIMTDKGQDAWAIKGNFEETGRGNNGLHGDCSLWFSTRTRKGSFRIETPDDPKYKMIGLEALSDAELRKEVGLNERCAVGCRDDFNRYGNTLNMHDQLVLKARAAQLIVKAFMEPRLEHIAHRALERGEKMEEIYT